MPKRKVISLAIRGPLAKVKRKNPAERIEGLQQLVKIYTAKGVKPSINEHADIVREFKKGLADPNEDVRLAAIDAFKNPFAFIHFGPDLYIKIADKELGKKEIVKILDIAIKTMPVIEEKLPKRNSDRVKHFFDLTAWVSYFEAYEENDLGLMRKAGKLLLDLNEREVSHNLALLLKRAVGSISVREMLKQEALPKAKKPCLLNLIDLVEKRLPNNSAAQELVKRARKKLKELD